MEMNQTETNSVRTGASLLDTLTSALYADPIVVFREYVQNAVDSFSSSQSKRDFKVVITIDSKSNQIIIRDNGDGIPPDTFEEKMCSFGKSEKMGHKDQVGFRGIGRLSGLSFCEDLQFINMAKPEEPQFFSLCGKYYREILLSADGGSSGLKEVLNKISSKEQPEGWCQVNKTEPGFEVIMKNVSQELWTCICMNKPARGKQRKQKEQEKNIISLDKHPTEDFFNELSMLLPLPYCDDFTDATEIHKKYDAWIGSKLAFREFNVSVNNRQLFKPFKNVQGTDFQVLPIQIFPMGDDNGEVTEKKIIGVLWIRFDYVFKAVKQNWGIAVRSKNMLVRGGSVLAEEAAEDREAITSYGQYLSALKGVTGELLLETDCLADNSRRDWFKVNKNSLQLRNQLCKLMNRMHTYRYKISRYMHNDLRTEAEKQSVISAYRELVSQENNDSDKTTVEQYITDRFREEETSKIDVRADERDILGYTTTQKRFYRTLMLEIYSYFENKNIIIDYFALKAYILRNLNQDSIEPESESTTGNE